jgi:hypothetical protein
MDIDIRLSAPQATDHRRGREHVTKPAQRNHQDARTPGKF